MKESKTAARWRMFYAATLLVSAALLFLLQPLSSKLVLPRFGGAPAVWSVCMLFFQGLLLAGYLYAHWVTARLSLRAQVILHALVMLVPLGSLPIASAQWEAPAEVNPVPWLLALLATSFGAPFWVVSTTTPLLQSWFARLGRHGGDPYPLYAASNAGSLFGLLAYPLVLEPLLPLSMHGWVWSCGYVVLLVLVGLCGAGLWRLSPADPPETTVSAAKPASTAAAPKATWLERLHWIALAFAPSSLMLSVTLHLTSDVAPIPLLWVIPLALYLLTFVMAFGNWQILPPARAARAMPLFVIALAVVMISEATEPVWLLMLVHLAAFWIVALVCHGELARRRPPPMRLTEFYLCLSVGGILGGVFSALVAPLVFRSVAEYPLVLVLACALRPAPNEQETTQRKPVGASDAPAALPAPARLLDWLLPAGLGLVTYLLLWASEQAEIEGPALLAVAFGLPTLVCYLFLFRPLRFALGIGALLVVGLLRTGVHGEVLYAERSFFGIHRVTVHPNGRFVELVHGNTLHGKQRLDSSAGGAGRIRPGPAEPLTYYHRSGPIGQVMRLPKLVENRPSVAVVGLGTGSLAAYAMPGQQYDFYEIDPAVQRIAEEGRYFTFLKECRGKYRILLGDARLKLKGADDSRYGLIVIDAFSSDSVPLHLITREALTLYLRKLAPDGLLAFHVSNRYLDLAPVLGDLAGDLGLVCVVRHDLGITNEEAQAGKVPSSWVVIAQLAEDVEPLVAHGGWRPQPARPGRRIWTDDYSHVLGAFKSQ
jgi:hypothetical protein